MSDTAAGKPFTGRHMVVATVTFFGVVIAVNVGMAVLAATSWTGLVVDNSYVAGQEFESKRIAHEAQVAAGWRSTFTFVEGRALLRVIDGQGAPIDLGTVTLLVNRPVGGHDDQRFTLTALADGSYDAPLTLATGVWDAHFTAADTAKGPYELHERFSVAGAGQ